MLHANSRLALSALGLFGLALGLVLSQHAKLPLFGKVARQSAEPNSSGSARLGPAPQPAQWAARAQVGARQPADSALPTMTSSYNPNHPALLEASEIFFYKPDSMHGNHSIADYGQMALAAKGQSVVYSDIYIHRYDSFAELKQAAGPEVDQELCLRQLTNLVERTEALQASKYRSRDINLYQLLDTFGHLSSGLMLGNSFVEGMYNECLRLKIRWPQAAHAAAAAAEAGGGTRYCLATFKHQDWAKIDRHDLLKLKAGVCLPRACDSLNYRNKYQLVWTLFESQLRDIERGQTSLDELYCLPDESSPLRSPLSSWQASATLGLLGAWLALLAYATRKHSQLSGRQASAGAQQGAPPVVQACTRIGLSNGLSPDEGGQQGDRLAELFALLSVKQNLLRLFDISKQSSLAQADNNSPPASGGQREHSRNEQAAATAAAAASQKSPVDLGCIEGVKVIAMCYVILGHVLMCITPILSNGRELTATNSVGFYVANLVPAFAVNSFFTITGILTVYLLLRHPKADSFVSSPSKWLAFAFYRYLRIMPLYALVVLYTKTLAKYSGSGPLWDYGTSSLGQRKACEQEPWFWTLLFASNFLPPLKHCIPAGWYLSNDFQFALITPLLVALLQSKPKLARRLLVLGALAGYLAGFWSIFQRSDIDMRSIAKFAPNGFKTYISQFSYNYTQPQYRIPAYLIGLLMGHKLLEFERATLATDNKSANNAPDWSQKFKNYAVPVSLLLVVICCSTPLIGSYLTFTPSMARFMVAMITPTYHVAFALAIGSYLLLATTGNANKTINKFLSAPAWKPFARLSLCAVLVNVEVISYIVQTNTNLHYISNQYHMALNMLCIFATYLVSTVVCVLFEAPIRGVLNQGLAVLLSKYTNNSSRTVQSVQKKVE